MTATPETLHLLAHQAALRGPACEDWWDTPLDTALAALSSARHPPAHRERAERAVARLQRWHATDKARRISADTTALALAAATATQLAQTDQALEQAAVEALADLASRGQDAAPTLHLALCCFALDRVAPDRELAPWPELRAHFEARRAHGLDAALVALCGAFAARRFDAAELVRGLLNAVPASPSLSDGAIVLWILTAALERCSTELGAKEPGLQALVDRRSEIAARLAQELDRDSFELPPVEDFDPGASETLGSMTYLSRTEALLIDLSLASAEPESPWLRYEEAEGLFGKAAAETRDELRERETTLVRRTAVLVGALGTALGAVLWLSLVQAGAEGALAVAAGLALAGLAGTVAAVLARGERDDLALAQSVGIFSAILLLTGLAGIVNSSLDDSPLPETATLAGGALLAAAGALVYTAIAAAARRRGRH